MGKDLKGKELGKGYKQNKDGGYEFRFVNCFGNRQSVYSKNFEELKKKAIKAQNDSLTGMTIKDSTVILNEWFKTWLDVEKHGIIRDTTKTGYRLVYNTHIKDVIGKKKLCDITRLDVQRLLIKLEKSGSGFATRNRVKIMIADMLDKAIRHELLLKNVAKGITVKRDEEKEPRYLNTEEIKEFLGAARGTFYYNLFVVAIQSGLRPGELFALTEDSLDFEHNVIKVTRTLHYKEKEGEEEKGKQFFFGPPKTKTSVREVPISKVCKDALLRQLKQKQVVVNREIKKVDKQFINLLFTTRFNTPLNVQIALDAINRILDELNTTKDEIEQFEKFSMHSLRHTFATQCLEKKVELKTLQMWLGHATLSMTEDLYVHLSNEFSQEQVVLLDTKSDIDLEEDIDNNIINVNFQEKLSSKRSENGVVGNYDGVEELLKSLVQQALQEQQSKQA